jgi:hypothetical protein
LFKPLEPVYVGFRGQRTTNLGNGDPHWRDRNFMPGIPGGYLGLCRELARVRNGVARSFPSVLRYNG